MKKTSDYACLNVQKRIDEQIFQFTYYRHNEHARKASAHAKKKKLDEMPEVSSSLGYMRYDTHHAVSRAMLLCTWLFAEQTFSNLRLPQGATSGINRNALAVCVKVRKIKFEKFKGWSTKAHTQKGKNKL